MASHSDPHAPTLAHDDDYVHGDMDTSAQSSMYQAFLVASQWGCVLIAAMVACMALIWGADVKWLPAVLGCGAGAILAGLGMNMGGAFTITSVGFTLIGLLAGGISTLVGMFS
jgi:Bacterial aa3 type cytochrome c oxidase subunit IV